MDEVPEETGIQSSEMFDWFVSKNESLGLFTKLFDDPFDFLRSSIAGNLERREAGARLTRLTITGYPVTRGDGHPDYDKPEPDPANPALIITRVALYVPFTARVESPSKGTESVQGALTCVVGNVNQPDNRQVQTFMDVDELGLNRLMTPDHDTYQSRMLSVGEWLPSDYPPGSPEREGLRPV